jgi:hypothetical protein
MSFATSLHEVVTTNDGDQSLAQTILSNLNALNSLATVAKSGSTTQRASAACEVSKFIFGSKVITPSSPNYSEEQDVNWYVPHISVIVAKIKD